MSAVLRYLVRRLLLTIPVLLGVATLVFSLIHLVPGDPAQAMLGDSASPQDVAELRANARPRSAAARAVRRVPARRRRAAISARRSAPASRSTHDDRRADAGDRRAGARRDAGGRSCIAIPLGIVAAVWRGTADRLRRDDAGAGRASRCRTSGSGPLLAIVFSVELGWLPVSGRGTLAHLVLPAVTLGAALAAILARMTRASLLEELRRAVRAGRARARRVARARRRRVTRLRNSLIPIVTVLGLQFGAVLTGAVITETIFAWPGIGRLLIQSIGFRDYPLVQGCILLIAVTYVPMNLLTDLVYGVLDPRIRFE